MAKKKNFYYVLVFTSEGPKYVTHTERTTAHWDEKEIPLELGKQYAEEVTRGLLLNFFNAVMVCMPVELTHQPYMYERGHFEFVKEENNEQTT